MSRIESVLRHVEVLECSEITTSSTRESKHRISTHGIAADNWPSTMGQDSPMTLELFHHVNQHRQVLPWTCVGVLVTYAVPCAMHLRSLWIGRPPPFQLQPHYCASFEAPSDRDSRFKSKPPRAYPATEPRIPMAPSPRSPSTCSITVAKTTISTVTIRNAPALWNNRPRDFAAPCLWLEKAAREIIMNETMMTIRTTVKQIRARCSSNMAKRRSNRDPSNI